MPDRPPTPSGGARTAGLCALACSLLLAAFAVISLSAALTKSATIDEPLCGTAAYVNWFLGDYHNDPDNPPLWKYWAMLPYRSTILKFDPSDPVWQRSLTDSNYTWFWATQVLFMTPGTDGMAFINAERRMLVLLGVFAGALTAFWAYRLGGAPAAVATTTLFALDPTLLAHASLVKNDTAQMLLFVALSMTLWKIGQRATFWNLLGGSLICGLALGTKFSGLIIPPIAIITLSCRALLVRDDWPAFGRTLRSRFRKLLVPLAFGLLVVPVSYGTIWAVYRFRFAPTPDPSVRLDMELVYHSAVQRALLLEYRRVPTSQETAEASKPLAVRCIKFAHEHRLLPEAWLHGFMRIYGAVIANDNYLLGDIRKIGWWYYFLVALPVKTPVATILAAALAVGAAWMLQDSAGLARRTGPSWNWLAVLLPGALYFASGFRTNLNTGVRHMLPILPLAFIAVGVVASQAYRVWPRGVKWSSIVLALALATESLLAWPNYISFFNAAVGGSRGGFELLGDSNLDWGQDLPLLADWQRRHPDEKLYLAYFGSVDPKSYGVRYTPMAGGFFLDPAPAPPLREPGVLAVSASILQCVHLRQAFHPFYTRLRALPAREVLGGSIYLFDYPQSGVK